MTRNTTWSLLGVGWWRASSREVPAIPLTEAIRSANRYPATITTVADEGVSQHIVFDPSMKQHVVALRASEPRFADPGQGERWYAARRTAIATVLKTIADSEHWDKLVLRGSVLLKAWYGDAAREPGDLDFVVAEDTWELTDPRTDELFDAIALGAERASQETHIRIHANSALSDEIWTYDRVPGRRLVLPWSAEGCPDGSIQLDFVFGERLPEEPRVVDLEMVEGRPATVLAASPELSLAWKILWLVSDMYPQGKDLYDAVLLAESAELSYELLYDAFVAGDPTHRGNPVTLRSVRDAVARVDWEAFGLDHGDSDLEPDSLGPRLLAVLEPVFRGSDAYLTEYQQRVRWLTPLIDRSRPISGRRLEAVHTEIRETSGRFETAIILTRELARELTGAAPTSVEEAARQALALPTWQNWADHWQADYLDEILAGIRAAETETP